MHMDIQTILVLIIMALCIGIIVALIVIKHLDNSERDQRNFRNLIELLQDDGAIVETAPTGTGKKPKSSEVIDTLDWMLQHQIITSEEYNKLMGKSLPFLG